MVRMQTLSGKSLRMHTLYTWVTSDALEEGVSGGAGRPWRSSVYRQTLCLVQFVHLKNKVKEYISGFRGFTKVPNFSKSFRITFKKNFLL